MPKKSPSVGLDRVITALARASFALPHARPEQLPAPFRLAESGLAVPELDCIDGTFVVVGDLDVGGDVSLRRSGKLSNIVVTGDLRARHVYFDAFLVVGGTLRADTVIGDVGWDGGLFVGAVEADTLVLKDTGLDFLDDEKLSVKRFANLEEEEAARKAVPELFDGDDVDAFGFFLSLPRALPARKA